MPASSKNEVLHLQNSIGKNTKVSPNTVLALITQGKISELNGAGTPTDVVFRLKPSSFVLVQGASRDHPSVAKLTDVIAEHKVNAMYQHTGWIAGATPTSFASVKTMAVSVPADIAKLASNSAQSTHWLWIIEVKGAKIIPFGVALCTKKQVVLKAGDTVPLA